MAFSAPPVRASFRGFLFDMDVSDLRSEIGVAPEVILETSHGRRSIDILKILAPDKANWEYVKHMEGLLPQYHGKDAHEIPGARALLKEIGDRNIPWAIVTSGTVPLVTGWLKMLGLPNPEHLVTAESVQNGKPDPSCYLMGLERVGLAGASENENVLVLEDSPAGIKAGKAAGCKVLGLVTSHTPEQVKAAEPDWIVRDLDSVKIVGFEDGLVTLEFSNRLAELSTANGDSAGLQ
ncbi:haloacid dehalogenase-like hydrolase [Diaporthe helianthi]|uniref:Haloacid dehalogenase-like hydrolase n=1 Tax=Diaporthe helianthi TaxID=158607 RepID=A0A2P5HQ68_DIAHE|nr:haloacid dehalogenase-like hydrolase [Diaporthe helianthi]